jgi:hypothetical protein
MNYGDILREAFQITWRNKFLWFFGFFVAGGTSSFNIPSTGGNGTGGGTGGPVPPQLYGIWRTVQENLMLVLVVAGIAFLVVFLVFLVLALLSDAALAESAAAIHRGEGRRFGVAWRTGLRFVWRVLGLRLLLALISLALLLVAGIIVGVPIAVVFVATESVAARVLTAVLLGLLGILLLIAVFIPLAVIGQWALRRAVVENSGAVASIGEAYRFFRRNMGKSLLIWLLQVGVMLGLGIALLIAAVIVALPLALPVILLAVGEFMTAAVIVGVVMALIFLAIFFTASGALGAFNHTYWTLSYLRLSELDRGSQPATA